MTWLSLLVIGGCALAAGAALCEVVPTHVAAVVIGIADVYLALALVESAMRSRQDRLVQNGIAHAKPPVAFELPSRAVSLLVFPMLLAVIVLGFARLYLAAPCLVVHTTVEVVDDSASATRAPAGGGGLRASVPDCISTTHQHVEPLQGRLNAAYFSAVTLMTVGYGDFVPAKPIARWLVLCEFGSGLLLLAGAFPLLVSRLADF